MPPILYKNIQHGKEVMLCANEYEQSLVKAHVFEDEFLKRWSDYVEGYSKTVYTNQTVLYTIRYRGLDKQVCILWGPLKNSGTANNARKRLQVLPCTELKNEHAYFAIVGYNTLDTTIYTIMTGGVREFIRHAKNGTAYSSLWFDYSSLWDAYKKGKHRWTDSKGRELLACNVRFVEDIHLEIIAKLSETTEIHDENNYSEEPVKFVEIDVNMYKDDDSLPRNPLFRDIALKRENYTCELCGTQRTFTDKNNEEYFEGHHLVMYNLTTQKRFKKCLDHPDNIICLCPNCHRHIHHASVEGTRKMLLKLFTKHHKLPACLNIQNLDDIIKDYTK